VVAIDDPASLLTLQPGEPPGERRALALVAAGTGLGVALMWWAASGIRLHRRRADTPTSPHRMT
jgi:hypothetical protein